MIFKESGNKDMPTIFLLHGGGLSDWSLQPVISLLQADFHLVTPIIDGHGEDGKTEFISIEDSAEKLISFIDKQHMGRVFAMIGLSIGAQIITEVLSKREEITQYAVLESALVYPIRGTTTVTVPTYQLFYPLIKKRWFSKMQAKTLCVPDHLFETYYQDSLKITKQSLINITLCNGNYHLKPSISHAKTKVLIIVGSKEIGIMKKSADKLYDSISGSQLFIAAGMKHGELSLVHTEEFIALVRDLFNNCKKEQNETA